jgi:predicted helicase
LICDRHRAAQDLLTPDSPAHILVLVPSLALVSQTLKAWSLAQPWGSGFHSCCVCSDDTIADDDEIELNPNELPIPVTTQPDEIRRFLIGSGVRTVFSTYQSSERVREAVDDLDGFEFDLAICDEAHRTARAGHSDFTLPLDEERLPIRRRLFMTATRRIFAPKIKKTSVVHSMDDVPLYGQIAYSLNFRQAADLGIICPYKLLVSVVTKSELADYIQQTGVRMDGRTMALEEIAGRYALSQAMTRLGLRKAFTFHKTVSSAASFVARGEFGLERFLPDFTCLHVSGAMRTAERETRMAQFRGEDPAIMSNARCLNEGIDVPAVDLVAFMDPKRSMVDIVQAIGRALRKPRQNSTKTYGYILLPVYIDAEDATDIDTAVEGSEFEDVWYVLRALMAQDLQLTETVEKLRVAQLRNKAPEATDSLSGFLQVIGSAEVEDVLRSSIKVQVVEELGEFARLYARDPQPYVAIDGVETKVKAFLEHRFGQEVRINRKRGETADGLIDFSISCSNSKVYMEKHTFFNAVTPEDRTRQYFVIWSEYSRYGFVIPTSVFDGFLTVENSTRKKNEKYDWNVLTTYGPHGDFLKFKSELLDVTDYRVDYMEERVDPQLPAASFSESFQA